MRKRALSGVPFALLSALLSTACSLTDTVTETSQNIVVAEVYLRTDAIMQTAWLHRTRQADGAAAHRVDGAQIQVTRENGGQVLDYEMAPSESCLVPAPDIGYGSCYTSNANANFAIVPGERYHLRIVLPDGGVMTGSTTVPGDFDLVRPQDGVCTVPPGTTFEIQWTSSADTWAYISEMHVHGLRDALAGQGIEVREDPLRLVGLSITRSDTTIVFPREFGLFDRFDSDLTLGLAAIQGGLPLDTYAEIIIGAGDRNYVNWERGGNFNPSGLVRIASIRGAGTGTFGSLVVRTVAIHVTDDPAQPC